MIEKIVRTPTIGGVEVKYEGRAENLEVYTRVSSREDELRIYLVKGEDVVCQMEIEADCGQNVGYISEFNIEGLKK